MGKTSRKRYTREFKLSLIRELESGKKLGNSVEKITSIEYDFQMELEYDKDPESAFKGNGNTYKDTARNEELERLVGKLYAENDFLKKALGILKRECKKRRRDRKQGEIHDNF